MIKIWKEIGVFDTTEQRLADQSRAIRTNGWLSEIEMEEIQREIEREQRIDEVMSTEEGTDMENSLENECKNDNRDETSEEETDEEISMTMILARMIESESSEERKSLLQELAEEVTKEEAPLNLRNVDRGRLKEAVRKINDLLTDIPTANLTETNKLLLAAARLAGKKVGAKKRETTSMAEPWWKRRLNGQIAKLRKDLSRLDKWKSNQLKSMAVKEQLETRYKVKKKGIEVVIEELKQRVVAKAAKVKRYEGRVEQYRQNRMYQSNQKRLFERLENKERSNEVSPDTQENKKFWSDIWDNPASHNEQAKWLKDIETDLINVKRQDEIVINLSMVRKQLKKMPNWKSPGPDGLQGYWVKNFTSCHERLALQLRNCMSSAQIPDWLTTGKTTLVMKDKDKGGQVTNFRPITCLPLVWKLLTGIIAEELYGHLEKEGLFPDEQKGGRRKSRGTKDQLLIDKMIIRNCKRRLTGLGMAWVDYKKAYDMVPHSWIRKCMLMFGVVGNATRVLDKSMDKWCTELTSCGRPLGMVNIRRGIFQGDSLSPLLFVMALIPLTLVLRKVKAGYDLAGRRGVVNHLLFMDDLKLYGKSEKQVDTLLNTVRVFSQDIGMQFGINKCAVLVLKRGKVVRCEGIEMPNNQVIKSLGEGEGYKYLGMLEADGVKHMEMKENVTKEYYRRVRKILKSKLNGGNVINAINTRAVAIIRYGAGIIKWTKEELRNIDRKTRKLMNMHRALHPQADVDRLYIKRAEGGRGMISVEDCVEIETNSLHQYIIESKEKLLKGVKDEGILGEGMSKEDVAEKRKNQYKEKPLHGQYVRSTEEIRDDKSWNWLKRGALKKETEGTLMAAQDQALRTNAIKSRIDKQDISPMCRLCGEREETISHIVAECTKLAQKQYRHWRHDRVALVIHWTLCKRFGFPHSDQWYEHVPERVLENENVKLLWDFSIQTDHHLEHNKPDILIHEKTNRGCYIIDVACPFDTRVKTKELEKVERYHDLKREIGRIWECRNVCVVPIVIGALGTLSKNFSSWAAKIEVEEKIDMMQKACVLGTEKIIRNVLDI